MDINDTNNFDTEEIDRLLQDAMDGSLSTEMAPWSDVSLDNIQTQAKMMVGTIVGYKELMMMYACAMKEIRTKFEVLNTEFKIRYQRNPIASISTRLKRTASILEKLERHNLPFSLNSIVEHINDIAGIRVICSYIDDIYTIADALLRQDDVTLIDRKDYIANPKPNGYRSLHLIVSIPVFFADQKKEVRVEVQIRTIAMDFWASLEHQLKYKQEIPNQQEIIARLKECADVINDSDEKMLGLRQQIETAADAPSEEEVLFEKLSRLDINLE